MNNHTSEIHNISKSSDSITLWRVIDYAQSLWFWIDFEKGDDFLLRQVFKFYNPNLSQCLIYSLGRGFYSYSRINEQWKQTMIQVFWDDDIHLLNPREFSYKIDSVTLIIDNTYTVLQKILLPDWNVNNSEIIPPRLFVPTFEAHNTFWH